MAFAYLYKATGNTAYYNKAIYFLNVLEKTKCSGYRYMGWGYPFDWMTNGGLLKKGSPLITTVPYVYDAFAAIYEIDEDKHWLEIMDSISKHVAYDYLEKKAGKNAGICSYTAWNCISPKGFRSVVNANAYRAFLLMDAYMRTENNLFFKSAEKNLNFVMESQRKDGSWTYAADGTDNFIDNFHTCFVLKNLIKIDKLISSERCQKAIHQGLDFYSRVLLDKGGLPVPFARKSKIAFYQKELYDYAEAINLCLLLESHPELGISLPLSALEDLLNRWQKLDGSFYTRKHLLGWHSVPFHRWAQSQIFRSLTLYLYRDFLKISRSFEKQRQMIVINGNKTLKICAE